MGWLELLPLVRRLLPMLSQLTPLLESVLAGRAGARAEAERTSTAMATFANAHADLTTVLQRQEEALTLLTTDVAALRSALNAQQDRAAIQEQQLNALRAALRAGFIAFGSLLLLCLILLAFLVAKRA